MITIDRALAAYPLIIKLRELDDLRAEVVDGKAFACNFHGRYDDEMADELRPFASGALLDRRAKLTAQLRELGVIECDDRHAITQA